MKHLYPITFASLLFFAGCFSDSETAISVDDLDAAIKAGTVTVIDVNGSASYAEGHIPGAIDFEAVEANLKDALPEDKNALVVAYCGGPLCPAYKDGVKAAEALGYSNVKHFSGGISGWKKAGKQLEK